MRAIKIYNCNNRNTKINYQTLSPKEVYTSAWTVATNGKMNHKEGRSTICEHISNIFKEGELEEKVVCRKFRQTTQHGALEGKTQSREVKYYNLDVIISVGYRVKSIQGMGFRQWACSSPSRASVSPCSKVPSMPWGK